MTICAAMPVYNEERRIEATLRSVAWCDEIVILDKQSTDCTRDIARRYTDKIIVVHWQEYRPEEMKIILDHVTTEWVLICTASDLIHPKLAMQIQKLTAKKDFPYDVIHVPFRRYILGLDSPRSPWHGELSAMVFRKSILKINYDSVHSAISFGTNRHYKIPISEYCMYHLSHETMDMMMDRHIRYWQAQAKIFPSERPLYKLFTPILRSAFHVFIRRKTWLMGWDGIALIAAFMSYSLLQSVYIWERRRCKAPQTYQNIRESIAQAWEQFRAIKHDDK